MQGYVFGLLIEKSRERRSGKVCLAAGVALSLAMLAYFKYADFMIANLNALTGLSVPFLKIALPIGISFYTFQIVSYLIDVYRGEVPAQRNFIDLAAYIAMFPQLIAGPIVRYSDIAAQIGSRTHTCAGAAYGVRRFVIGLSKKILIANLLGSLASAYKTTQDASVLFGWLYAAAFMLQIYYDFPATVIWRSDLEAFSASDFPRTSTIHILRAASRSSGGGGTSRSAHGSGIISMFRWAATGRERRGSF